MLAFDRDPLFSNLQDPLLRIETRRDSGRERWCIWKERDFFWFWIEDSPDFFGLFGDDGQSQRIQMRHWGWFERAATLGDGPELRDVLKNQIHHGQSVRAISLSDPRPGKSGVWRVLWRRRHFLLQHAENHRAVTFHPETQWDTKSPHWKEMKRLNESAEFFAERFWPLLKERQGRLSTAFEFLELPVAEQRHPVRFARGDEQQFRGVLRAALITDYTWSEGEQRTFHMRFHHRHFTPIYGHSLTTDIVSQTRWRPRQYESEPENPHLKQLADTFQPVLSPNFASHSVAPSPFSLAARDNQPSLQVAVRGPFTFHELLEAHLTVRDWLAANAPELLPDWEK